MRAMNRVPDTVPTDAYRLGLSVHDAIASAPTIRDAIDRRLVLSQQHGFFDASRLMIWLRGHCAHGLWVVGPDRDAPSPLTWGRMGFMTDTLHEALVARRAIESMLIWPPPLRVWERDSHRRMTTAGIAEVLTGEAMAQFHWLERVLKG